MERQPRVDDVLDDQHVAALDARVEILQELDRGAAAGLARAVAGELDEVDAVDDRERPGQIGEEDDAGLQRPDEKRRAAGVVVGDLGAELPDPGGDLRGREVDVADAVVVRQEASFSPYR